MDIDSMTPGEVALARRVQILESKLAQYENPIEPTYMTEDHPSMTPVHSLSTSMELALKARVKSDGMHGYHVFAKDIRTNYGVNYYVSNLNLTTNRYRIAEYLNTMLRELTNELARDIERGVM